LSFTGKTIGFAEIKFYSVLYTPKFDQKLKTTKMENNQTQKRIAVGVVILLAGLTILLSNLGFLAFEIKRYLITWQMFLIIPGFIFIFTREKRGTGIILLMLGIAFYLRDIYDLNFSFWQIFIPCLLILAGVLILFKHKIGCVDYQKKNVSEDDIIDEVNIFGGGDRTIVSQNFSGGKILAIFGGSNFNMSRAKLAPGQNVIDVMAVFGGMKLIVPEDWKIKINVISIFGGFSDKHTPVSNSNAPSNNELIIKGFVMFGGGEIKSY
jgi:predicted membrane protein